MRKYIESMQKYTLEDDNCTENAVKSIMKNTTEEFLNNVSLEWSNLSIAEKQKISLDLAGIYNQSRFYAMMQCLEENQ